MTIKKYIFILSVFSVFCLTSLILLYMGLEKNSLTFILAACISFIFSIVFIALNYKKLAEYEYGRIRNKVKNLDFSCIETTASQTELFEKLEIHGYKKTANGLYHKAVSGDDEISVVEHYYVALLTPEAYMDIQKFLEKFHNRPLTYNIGFIFLNENIEQNLEALKSYMKETVLDVETHRYGNFKKFFTPMIITANRIYYLNAGSFMNEYRMCLREALRVFNDSSNFFSRFKNKKT